MGDAQRMGMTATLMLACVVVLWIVGILLLCLPSEGVQPEGLVAVCAGATGTVLIAIRSWLFRMERAFVHGYHAGWHDATAEPCYPADRCDVLEISEVRSRRVNGA